MGEVYDLFSGEVLDSSDTPILKPTGDLSGKPDLSVVPKPEPTVEEQIDEVRTLAADIRRERRKVAREHNRSDQGHLFYLIDKVGVRLSQLPVSKAEKDRIRAEIREVAEQELESNLGE